MATTLESTTSHYCSFLDFGSGHIGSFLRFWWLWQLWKLATWSYRKQPEATGTSDGSQKVPKTLPTLRISKLLKQPKPLFDLKTAKASGASRISVTSFFSNQTFEDARTRGHSGQSYQSCQMLDPGIFTRAESANIEFLLLRV